jgi:hypothetical protein
MPNTPTFLVNLPSWQQSLLDQMITEHSHQGILEMSQASSACTDGIAMIQDVCDSVTFALSIRGCPELSAMVTDLLSKEFTRLVYVLALYGIELFRSDLRTTLAVRLTDSLSELKSEKNS